MGLAAHTDFLILGKRKAVIEMSFEGMVKRIDPKLKGIVHRLNGHFTFFDDKDLYQEALVHLWGSWKEEHLDGKTESYILQGCFFYLKNYIRTALDRVALVSMETLIEDSDMTLAETLPLEAKDSPLDSLESELVMAQFSKAGLTDRERAIIDLTLDGLTTREIGERLGVSHVRIVKVKKNIRAKCALLRRELPKG